MDNSTKKMLQMVGKKHKHNLNDAKHKDKHHLLLEMATTVIMHHRSLKKTPKPIFKHTWEKISGMFKISYSA